MAMFNRGGIEMKKVMAFIGLLASIVWLTITIYVHVTLLWFLTYCVFLAFIGGPYFASKMFGFLATFMGGRGADLDK